LPSFHQLLYNHHHLSSGAGTIGQTVAAVPSGLSLTPLRLIKNGNSRFLQDADNRLAVIVLTKLL
jgi:hypothetical protein